MPPSFQQGTRQPGTGQPGTSHPGTSQLGTRAQRATCADPVIGAILSGWRYDLSGLPEGLSGEYTTHLGECAHCRHRQRVHRTIDVLLLAATTLSFAAFLLAALVMHRLEALTHIDMLHVHLPVAAQLHDIHMPAVIAISLEAVALAGMAVSMLLWVLVLTTTPVPVLVSGFVRQHFTLRKQEA
jgi:hypothetical protein